MDIISNQPNKEEKHESTILNSKAINRIENMLGGAVSKQIQSYNSVDSVINTLQSQVQTFQAHIDILNEQIKELKDQRVSQKDQIQEVQNAQSELTNFGKMIETLTNTKNVKIYPIPSLKGDQKDDVNLFEQEIPQQNEATRDIESNNQYLMHQQQVLENTSQEKLQNIEMLNPIMPPIAKINHKKNTWAVKRLDNCFPKLPTSNVTRNIHGKQFVHQKSGTWGFCFFSYIHLLPITLIYGSLYECFGICCCLRKQFLEGVDIVICSQEESTNPIFFSEHKIKILRLYYEYGELLKLNLSKFKNLVELSIQAVNAQKNFIQVLADELKACENIQKLTLDINTLQSNQIETVLGYMQQLQSFSIRIKDEFNFNCIEYNLPKLKELNMYDQTLNSLNRISDKFKELLIFRLHTKVTDVYNLKNILENFKKNGVPLRQLCLLLNSSLNDALSEQISQLSSLQILEIQQLEGDPSLIELDCSKLKNLEILHLNGLKISIKNLESCHYLKSLDLRQDYLNVSANSLVNLYKGIQHAQKLQYLEIHSKLGSMNDETLDNIVKALADKQNLKWFIIRAANFNVSDNSLIKLTSTLLSNNCQLERFSLRSESISEITGQSFENFFQSIASIKSLLIFEVDIKGNKNISEQSIQEVTPSINKIKRNVKRYNIVIENLGRVKADILSRISGERSRSISVEGETAKVQREYAYQQNGKTEALTVFDTQFYY